jgi:hypothetical protein
MGFGCFAPVEQGAGGQRVLKVAFRRVSGGAPEEEAAGFRRSPGKRAG